MHPSLVPDSSALLGEKVAGENHINIMKGETVRVGNILELFDEGRDADIFLSERVCLVRRRHVP